jgi:drug/metabolite transporter (DMT)-like permease
MMTPTNLFAFFDRPTQQNLESNQRGRLTPEQQSALKQGVRQQWWRVVLWAFVLLVLCTVFGLFFWALASEDLGPALLGPVLTTAGVFAIGLIVLAALLFPDLSLVFAGGDVFLSHHRDYAK